MISRGCRREGGRPPLLAAALVVVGMGLLPFRNAGAEDAAPTLSDQETQIVRTRGVWESEGWVYAFGQAQPSTQSSASMEAAKKKARLEAISAVLKYALLKAAAGSEELKAVSGEFRSSFLEVLARNYSAKATLRGFSPIQSGLGERGAWVVVAGPANGIDSGAKPDVIGLAKNLLANSGRQMSARQADVFFETAFQLGLSPPVEFWLRHQPDEIQAQIYGKPVEKGFRLWLKNEQAVEDLLVDDLSIDDLKQCMQLLPYSQRVNDSFVRRYRREGMTNCAGAVLLRSFACTSSLGAGPVGNNAPAWADAVRGGEHTQRVIRVILAAGGNMPAKEEAQGSLYSSAMGEYMTNTAERARPLAFNALEDSINADTLNLYGSIMRRMGFNELGAVLCRQARTCRPDHPYALVNEALCMEALSRHQVARQLAAEALKNPDLDAWGKSEANKILERGEEVEDTLAKGEDKVEGTDSANHSDK